MKKLTLNKTTLEVSKIAMGTADYGTKYQEAEAFRQMDLFTDGGGNFLDTAYAYGSWVPGMGNASERVIGNWMRSRQNRSRMVISTKGAHPDIEDMSISRVYPKEIQKDIEASLEGLKTDYIDLYFLHRDNPKVPAEELLGCLQEQVNKGNIRYYGCSNWTLPRIVKAQQAAGKEGFDGFICNQLMYSLATADKQRLWDDTLIMMDPKTYENHRREGMNVMAYMALAKGYLVKKARGQEPEPMTGAAYGTRANERLAACLRSLEQEGYAPDEVSLAYLMNQELLTVPVVSFSRPEQLESALRSCQLQLPDQIMDTLNRLRNDEPLEEN